MILSDPTQARSPKITAALTLGALGVVYGDIGTSPLYALKEVFHAGHVPMSQTNVLGVLSLIFWTMTVIVSLKYVLLILRADNHGEGGLIAMLALATSAVADRPQLRRALLVVGMFGTAIFYGDGVITPAISVLSAVEGLEVAVASPALHDAVLPITIAVLTLLFAAQRFGTGGIGRAFGPITLLWFIVLIALGLPHVLREPAVLAALNPTHAAGFIATQPMVAFIALGAVVLVVTGGEALYADLGHFGKLPIRIAWYGLVMPALVVNYFGQGALLLSQPQAVENPFYLMAPGWARLPLVVLATAATVIASQALITAAFSVTKQAIQLGLLPRMRVLHTSVRDTGQIYVPFVNWGLYVLIVLAVGLFKSSTNLASAYGIAVTLDMTITTVMTFFVIRYGWKYPLWLCLLATGVFFAVDVMFFASNALKLLAGGWFPLVIGGAMFTLMLTWVKGRNLMSERLREDAIALPDFLASVFVEPATARARHRGLPVGRGRPDAERADAQPQAQQGAARVQPLRQREAPRGAVDRLRRPRAHDAAGPRLLAGHAGLRLQERPRRAGRAEAAGRPRRAAGRTGDELFPVARHRAAGARRRHGAVAREALRRHAPQCRRGGRLPVAAGQPRRRARHQGADLIARGRWPSRRGGLCSSCRRRLPAPQRRQNAGVNSTSTLSSSSRPSSMAKVQTQVWKSFRPW